MKISKSDIAKYVFEVVDNEIPDRDLSVLTISDLGVDSLKLIHLAMEIEDKFGLNVSLDDVTSNTSLDVFFGNIIAANLSE
jgi:acyl carrier protein